MAETASRSRPARAPRDGGLGDSGLAPLRVNYYRRMKPNRVYPWTVTWPRAQGERKGQEQELTLRLIIAGAQVVPAEQALSAAAGQNQITFFVTPIAKGWLKGQRLEVLMGGRKVQEIPLASKAVSQRRTLMLLLLTFLFPWFIWSFFHFPVLQYRPTKADFVDATRDSAVTQEMVATVKEVIGPPNDLKEHLPEDVIDWINKDVLPIYTVGFYQEFCGTIRDCKVGFYSGILLFLLTLGSWFCCRQKSKTLVGRSIPLSAGGDRNEE